MAKELNIEATPFTNADKSEYVKRYLHRPQIQAPSESPPSRSVPPTPPPSPTIPCESASNNHLPELEKMVRQVQEVLPHIAESIIRKDLRHTSCVDATITNILEEKVDLNDSEFNSPRPSSSNAVQTPSEPEGATAVLQSVQSPTATKFSSTSFGKTSSARQLSYQERKAALLESARRHYMEKHGMI
ncbi:lipid droplet-regulating VLDL assembly factor AUP1-like [Amphiura filiformis]|uniref:lipid droplet-regulating VLDL assembly factor AUP1-like n=1 Tax=Amphiura filiformis TaxID=82378 RepID=UPI003B20EEDB